MDLYEYEGKQLLAQYGVALPRGGLARSPQKAVAIQRDLRAPVVVKAQVLSGGRGKAGLIRFADDNDVGEVASAILASSHNGERVRSVLIEERINSSAELYASVYIDTTARSRKLLLSATGGIEVETARDKVRQVSFRGQEAPDADTVQAIWIELGIDRQYAWPLALLTGSLIALFLRTRARQVEVNPIGIVNGQIFALDSKVTVEDGADLPITREQLPLEPNEEKAHALGIPLVRLEGDIGIITSGAGLGLATIDTVQVCGGSAANFLDLGGGATAERMRSAVELVTSLEGIRGLLVNVHGGLNDCQLLAQGVLAALVNRNKLPALVRMSGFRAAEGRSLLEAARISTAGADSMERCVRRLLDAMRNCETRV